MHASIDCILSVLCIVLFLQESLQVEFLPDFIVDLLLDALLVVGLERASLLAGGGLHLHRLVGLRITVKLRLRLLLQFEFVTVRLEFETISFLDTGINQSASILCPTIA